MARVARPCMFVALVYFLILVQLLISWLALVWVTSIK